MLVLIGLACLPACTTQSTDAPSVSRTASPPTIEKKTRPRITPARLAKELHARINQERRRQGLTTFRWDAALGRIASKHSRDMAKRNYFRHISPEGKGLSQRYLKGRYACGVTINGVLRNGAEVIYRYSLDAAGDAQPGNGIIGGAIEAWTTSEADRQNLFSPHWQREGAGIFVAPDGTVYVTVNFC